MYCFSWETLNIFSYSSIEYRETRLCSDKASSLAGQKGTEISAKRYQVPKFKWIEPWRHKVTTLAIFCFTLDVPQKTDSVSGTCRIVYCRLGCQQGLRELPYLFEFFASPQSPCPHFHGQMKSTHLPYLFFSSVTPSSADVIYGTPPNVSPQMPRLGCEIHATCQ